MSLKKKDATVPKINASVFIDGNWNQEIVDALMSIINSSIKQVAPKNSAPAQESGAEMDEGVKKPKDGEGDGKGKVKNYINF